MQTTPDSREVSTKPSKPVVSGNRPKPSKDFSEVGLGAALLFVPIATVMEVRNGATVW